MGALDLIGMSTDGIHEVGVMAGRGRDLIAHLATIAAVVLQSRKQFDAKMVLSRCILQFALWNPCAFC